MTDAALPQPQGLSFAQSIRKVGSTGRPQSIAIIGMFKTGKTTLAASAAEIPRLKAAAKKVLILESESGTASIADDYPDVDLFPIDNIWQYNNAVKELVTRPHEYGVLVFDTQDKFQEYYIATNVDGANDTRKAWAATKRWMNETVWLLHKSNILAIFLFHESDDKNERTGNVKTTFKLAGSAKDDLGQIFDIIGRLTVGKDEGGQRHRYLQLAPADGQITGNRYEKYLPDVMVDPTMAKIFALIDAKVPINGATPVAADTTEN